MNLSKEGMTTKEIGVMKERLLDDFSYFAQLLTDPAFFDVNFHTDVCHFLQHSKKDKMLVLPRTYLKTTMASLYGLWRQRKIQEFVSCSHLTPHQMRRRQFVQFVPSLSKINSITSSFQSVFRYLTKRGGVTPLPA
jgi:hypothetical protein